MSISNYLDNCYHFDFNTYFILLEEKRIISEAQKNLKVLKKINIITKRKISYKFQKHLIYLNEKHKLSFELYNSLYKINRSFLQ